MSQDQADRVSNQANDKLVKIAADVTKVVELLNTSVSEHQDLTYKIADAKLELDKIELDIKEKRRVAELDLDLELKANSLKKANEILTAQGFSSVKSDEYSKLVSDHTDLKLTFNEKVTAETAKAEKAAQASAAIQIRQKEMELQVKEAANVAAITSLTKENQILQTQAATYLQQLNDERKARIEEAKARGNPSVVVNSGK